jgi:hypothetical protein
MEFENGKLSPTGLEGIVFLVLMSFTALTIETFGIFSGLNSSIPALVFTLIVVPGVATLGLSYMVRKDEEEQYS